MGTRIFFVGNRDKFDPGIAEFVILEFEQGMAMFGHDNGVGAWGAGRELAGPPHSSVAQSSECGILLDAVVAMDKDQPDPWCSGHRPLCTLTRQERLVLDLIAAELTNREIGERMHVQGKTIKNHVSQVLRKLGLKSRTQAAVLATEVHRGRGR